MNVLPRAAAQRKHSRLYLRRLLHLLLHLEHGDPGETLLQPEHLQLHRHHHQLSDHFQLETELTARPPEEKLWIRLSHDDDDGNDRRQIIPAVSGILPADMATAVTSRDRTAEEKQSVTTRQQHLGLDQSLETPGPETSAGVHR